MSDAENLKGLDELYTRIGKYKKSADYFELIGFLSRFPQLSPYNAMLAHVQRPKAEFLMPVDQWKKAFNVNVLPSACPVVVLRPFGPVSFLYDIEDTDGKNLIPEDWITLFRASCKKRINIEKIKNFINRLFMLGIIYTREDFLQSIASKIRKLENRDSFLYNSNEVCFQYFKLSTSKHLDEFQEFATIIHELGHMYCGHLGSPVEKWLLNRTNLTIEQEEFEAESVSWLVCKRYGIETSSEKYMSLYLENNDEIPNISIESVLHAVGEIEDIIKNPYKPPHKAIRESIISKKKQLNLMDL